MQLGASSAPPVSAPFQYRKRYGLHATRVAKDAGWKAFQFQYRKRYGLHATSVHLYIRDGSCVSIPQAVWIACNLICSFVSLKGAKFQYRKRYGLHAIDGWRSLASSSLCFNTASGMDCMQSRPSSQDSRRVTCFNTASGMDCMQYRPSQPLGQLNPEAGFLNGSLFLANRRNLAGFFCRQNRLKTSANPVISRKLLSTGKI